MDLVRQLKDVRFDLAVRGYDCAGVDTFLAKLRGEVADLQERAELAEQQLAEAPEAAHASETESTLRRTLVLAQRLADETEAEAKSAAAELVNSAAADAEAMRSEAEAAALASREQAEEELARASADAQEMRSMSESEAEKIREQARLHAHELLAQAEQAGGARVQEIEAIAQNEAATMREPVRQEVEELEGVRSQLLKDIAELESHLEAQRVRVRNAVDALRSGMSGSIEDLERVADDDDLMAPEPAPEHSNAFAGDVAAAPTIEFADTVAENAQQSAPELKLLDEQAAARAAELIDAEESQIAEAEAVADVPEAVADVPADVADVPADPAGDVGEIEVDNLEDVTGGDQQDSLLGGADTEMIPVVEAPPAPVVGGGEFDAPSVETEIADATVVQDGDQVESIPDSAGDPAEVAAFTALGAVGGAAGAAALSDDAGEVLDVAGEPGDGFALATAADLEEAELVVLEEETDPLFGTDLGHVADASTIDEIDEPHAEVDVDSPQPVEAVENSSSFVGRLTEGLDQVPIER